MNSGNSSGEPTIKKPRLSMDEVNVKIGTHNGTFHCDEALACYLLKLLPKYKNAQIVRTRDQAKLDECDIVVDVGGEFNPEKNRFDHHQRGFTETMKSLRPEKKWTTKLSSAGLIYCHFGSEIIKLLMSNISDEVLNVIYDMMYENFVEEIDAIDNGVNQYDGESLYKITTNLSARVGRLNPKWNEDNTDENEQFYKAVELVGSEFTERLTSYLHVWLPARCIVEKALEKRMEIDESGKILKLEKYCPWKEHLFQLEEENDLGDDIKYVLYQDTSSNWRIQCVPAGRDTFANRLSIQSEWRGLRNEQLSKLSGIPDCVFVHISGFIGGNKTYEGALKMARISLKQV